MITRDNILEENVIFSFPTREKLEEELNRYFAGEEFSIEPISFTAHRVMRAGYPKKDGWGREYHIVDYYGEYALATFTPLRKGQAPTTDYRVEPVGVGCDTDGQLDEVDEFFNEEGIVERAGHE